MIQIVPIQQLSDTALALISPNLVSLKQVQAFKGQKMGCFVVLKKEAIIGYGSVEPSVNAPPTAGIGQMNHYFIMPSERRQGYGTQLFHQLLQFSKMNYGLLEVPIGCRWRPDNGNITTKTLVSKNKNYGKPSRNYYDY